MTTQPILFVSHGAPSLAISDTPARRFLADYGAALPKPGAIAVVTAHWETDQPTVGGAATPATIHDFGGFPEALYRIRYAAPGAPELAQTIAARLRAAGMTAAVDPQRGLDHGAWVPLSLLFPLADVPVVPVSVQPRLGPAHAIALGRALAPLKDEGVLIVASGALTHNLRALDWAVGEADLADPRALAFADWVDMAIEHDDRDALLDYRGHAPFARFHHPTEEHLLPLFAALGAGGRGKRIHTSATFGNLMMDAYEFS